MERIVRRFPNGWGIIIAHGLLDQHCVFFVKEKTELYQIQQPLAFEAHKWKTGALPLACEENKWLYHPDFGESVEGVVEFVNGQKTWRLYRRLAPKDVWYFRELKKYAHKYGVNQIYDDFVYLYDRTGNIIDEFLLNKGIPDIVSKYGEDAPSLDIIFTLLYLGMVAEENKLDFRGNPVKLKKRIKRLGVHCLLFDNMTPHEAATFMTGRRVKYLEPLCEERGF